MKKLINVHIPDFNGKDLDELLNQFSHPLRNHSRRVAICSSIMAEYAGQFLRSADSHAGSSLATIAHTGGTCHDVGKLLMPTLKANESDYLRHPEMSAELLERYTDTLFSNPNQTQMILDIVRYHHERPDGSGFPNGLHTKDIPLLAGICAVANELDHRLYENKELAPDVFNEMKSLKRSAFCETALVCMEKAWPRLTEQYVEWGTIK